MNQKIVETIEKISKPNENVISKTQYLLDNLTKPKGSLGELEEIVKKVAGITNIEKPKVVKKIVFVLASDHGIVEEGVSAYLQEVTSQMVYNFLSEGAAINVFAKHTRSEVIVVDMGVKNRINSNNKNFRDRKVSFGTKNFLLQSAMSQEEAEKSIIYGIELVEEVLRAFPIRGGEILIIGTGEMGIGNSTSSSAITAAVCGKDPKEVVGRGTGIDDYRYNKKVEVVRKSLQLHKAKFDSGIGILSSVGGFEIGGIVGIILGCAANRIPVVLDGFISTSAALIACCLSCKVIPYMFAGHLSKEPGHKIQLEFLGLKPILSLDMRLGEGTGACLAMNIIELSCKVLNEMATFDSAGVSTEL